MVLPLETTVQVERMSTAKEQVREILDQLPDDATMQEIQYRIYVRQKIEASVQAAEEGRLLDHEEVERRIARWLTG